MIKTLIALAIALFIIMSFTLCGYKKREPPLSGTTTGTLYATQGYRSSMIRYSVHGNTFTHKMINPPFNAVDGEKYVVHFDPAKPDIYEVEFWNPVFSESEKSSTIVGTISREPYWYKPGLYAVEFTYQVGDSVYERGQKLSPTYKNGAQRFAVGQKYSVEFQVGYASRAVIHLNNELK